jgi:uncharacterized membrane protein YccC
MCITKISKDIYDAHNQEQNKKEREICKQRTHRSDDSEQEQSNHHQRHLNRKEVLQKRRFQEIKNAQALLLHNQRS